jgi:hypothetical protein
MVVATPKAQVPVTDLNEFTKWGFGAALVWNNGAQLALGTPRSRLLGRLRVEAQVLPGVKNISGSTPTAFLNHLLIGLEGGARLGHAAGVHVMAAALLLLDDFAPRFAVGVGAESARLGVRFEALGRAFADDPTFKEGSLRRGRSTVGYTLTKALAVSCRAEVQEAATPDRHWNVIGALGGRF